jgi:hypothetical protein
LAARLCRRYRQDRRPVQIAARRWVAATVHRHPQASVPPARSSASGPSASPAGSRWRRSEPPCAAMQHLLRAHPVRPRYRRDIRSRRHRLFQNPCFCFIRPATARHRRALVETIKHHLDNCRCSRSGLGCRLQTNLP